MGFHKFLYFCLCAIAAILPIFSIWCLMWVISSFSMAFAECGNAFDMFASNPRCRQPAIASLLAIAGILGTALAIFLAGRLSKRWQR